jgi:hypothetical protein
LGAPQLSPGHGVDAEDERTRRDAGYKRAADFEHAAGFEFERAAGFEY